MRTTKEDSFILPLIQSVFINYFNMFPQWLTRSLFFHSFLFVFYADKRSSSTTWKCIYRCSVQHILSIYYEPTTILDEGDAEGATHGACPQGSPNPNVEADIRYYFNIMEIPLCWNTVPK